MRASCPRLLSRRLAAAAPGLVGVVIVTFCLTRALPGDPAAYLRRSGREPAGRRRRCARSFGLDRSLPAQFPVYVRDLSRLDLGRSADHGPAGAAATLVARCPPRSS